MFGTKAGFFVDLFALLFVLILPAIFYAVHKVRQGRIKDHARIMAACFFTFLAAVLAFEIDVHTSDEDFKVSMQVLVIHLVFALPCLALWILQMATYKKAFLEPAKHRGRGKMLIVLLIITVGTGVWLYVETFT